MVGASGVPERAGEIAPAKRRILVAGLVHQTNTFVKGRTSLEDFEIRRGEEMRARASGSSLVDWSILAAAGRRERRGELAKLGGQIVMDGAAHQVAQLEDRLVGDPVVGMQALLAPPEDAGVEQHP